MSRYAARAALGCAAVQLFAVAAALAGPNDHGGAVHLKDGFVLKGYVGQPVETILDPASGQPVTIHKGMFIVTDLCRYFFFSHAYVDHADSRPVDRGTEVKRLRNYSFPGGKSLPPIRRVTDVSNWDENWNRSYSFEGPAGTTTLSQHLAILSPHYVRVNASPIDPVTRRENIYPWTSYYRTNELGPEQVVKLLQTHEDYKDTPGLAEDKRADRRFKIFNFLVQAGWMGAAEKELETIRRDFPKQKEQAETAATGIKRLVAWDRFDDIKRAQVAGRFEAAQKLLKAFPMENADDAMQAEVRTMRVRYEGAATAMKRARSLLADLPKEVTAPDDPVVFAEAAAMIAAELNFDHFLKKGDNEEGRLERFLTQADQAERLAGLKQPHLGASQLLALAVTGWLMGPAAAETKPESAARAWRARRFLREYQKTADAGSRALLLKDYEGKSPLGIAEVAQVIATLPPPEPAAKIDTVEVEMTSLPGAGKGTAYRLKLPLEYHHGQAYPVLIALHHAGESGKDMVKRWGEEAARYGYILACPEWNPGGGEYGYTPEEHAMVIDTLSDLRRHLNVDTDRVFLTGHGEGGNMAWDVGLSHPDLFAGVIPMCGQPRFHAFDYWTNALDLPFYVVWGEYMGGPTADKKGSGNVVIFNLFKDHWLPGGFPVLGVMYKGRGLEWFGGEVTDIFEWMAPKRRHNPMKVGFKEVVDKNGNVEDVARAQRLMRTTDNRFYWVTVDGVGPGRLRAPGAPLGNAKAATVAAKVAGGNQIGVFTDGVKSVSLWLGRGTVDFDKPITVRLNYNLRLNGVTVKPSLAVLLEDFHERGDRQRLYLARIDLK
jgi:pimeloyl-ACP methyl ester carboxylesterase